MKKLLLILVLAVICSSVVRAGDLEDGMEAYRKGEEAKALKLIQPLAMQGDADAQYTIGLIHGLTGHKKETGRHWPKHLTRALNKGVYIKNNKKEAYRESRRELAWRARKLDKELLAIYCNPDECDLIVENYQAFVDAYFDRSGNVKNVPEELCNRLCESFRLSSKPRYGRPHCSKRTKKLD